MSCTVDLRAEGPVNELNFTENERWNLLCNALHPLMQTTTSETSALVSPRPLNTRRRRWIDTCQWWDGRWGYYEANITRILAELRSIFRYDSSEKPFDCYFSCSIILGPLDAHFPSQLRQTTSQISLRVLLNAFSHSRASNTLKQGQNCL